MIMGAAIATVYFNLQQRHPTLDLPIIDYDLALLMGPMLILGIGIGVELNLLLANWMITILLIVVLFTTSSKSFLMGIATWKKETVQMKAAGKPLESTVPDDGVVSLHEHSSHGVHVEITKGKSEKVSMIKNLRPKELGILLVLWIAILAIQIAKRYTTTCTWKYWVLDALQIPATFAVAGYEAMNLYTGRRVIASNGSDASTHYNVYQLVLYCACGIFGGLVGGLLGLGGGFIMGPVFLQLGVPPQAH
uniref:Sulfite exporter TauE/SafE family protein n=1 Tax=Kalanchoe fedtschenkoi TaxID=63787 RepID=A0A7N0RBV0_KALFE